MKVLVYTAIFDDYDLLMDASNLQRDNVSNLGTIVPTVDTTFLCITDCIPKNECVEKGWIQYYADLPLTPTEANRFCKLNIAEKKHPIHNYEYDICIYLDGNKWIKNMDLLLKYCQKLYESDKSILLSNHWGRTTVLQEIQELIKLSLIPEDIAKSLYMDYLYSGFKDDCGLYCASVQIRKNNMIARDLLWEWGNEFREVPYRDQILLPYILWRYNYMNEIMIIDAKELLSFVEHKPHLGG